MKLVKHYIVGFILAYILTGISFLLVFSDIFGRVLTMLGIMVAGAIQIFVHLYYFLHVNRSKENRWDLMVLLFAFLILAFFIGGTIWVLFTLNQRMM